MTDILSGMSLLISILDCSLLVYRNVTAFKCSFKYLFCFVLCFLVGFSTYAQAGLELVSSSDSSPQSLWNFRYAPSHPTWFLYIDLVLWQVSKNLVHSCLSSCSLAEHHGGRCVWPRTFFTSKQTREKKEGDKLVWVNCYVFCACILTSLCTHKYIQLLFIHL
jgi:hypothetical protein